MPTRGHRRQGRGYSGIRYYNGLQLGVGRERGAGTAAKMMYGKAGQEEEGERMLEKLKWMPKV